MKIYGEMTSLTRKMTMSCDRCARCCQFIALPMPAQEDVEYWHLHGCLFYPAENIMLLPCECSMLLLRADGVHECAIYDKRPRICREFPGNVPPSVPRALKCSMRGDEK